MKTNTCTRGHYYIRGTGECKECKRIRNKKWADKKKEQNPNYYAEVLKPQKKLRMSEHREPVLKVCKRNHEYTFTGSGCPHCSAIRGKAWAEKNREKSNKQKATWAKKNPDYHSQYYKDVYHPIAREKQKARIKEDPIFRAIHYLRVRIGRLLRDNGYSKNKRTLEIVGCSLEHLYSHLVLSAMKNYGYWTEYSEYEVDHIIPLATAKTEEDVYKLNHYTNLQYLTPEDNRAKSDRLDFKL